MFRLKISISIGFLLYTELISVSESVETECVAPGSICNPHVKYPCCDINTDCRMIFSLHFICVKKHGLGRFCLSDQECDHILHAKCSKENRCVCRSNNLRINDTCVPSLGGFCWNDEKCAIANAVCIDRECRCKNGYIQRIDQCIFNSNHITCQSSDYCKKFSKYATCSNKNHCECERNHTRIEIGCALPLYMNCTNDEPCADINSACIGNVCRCKSHYVSKNGVCLPRVYLHNSCIDHSDCIDNTFTQCGADKRCTCRNNYFERNGSCLPGLGAYCWRTEQCVLENSFCFDNKCQCTALMTSSDGQCSKKDLLGKQCESNLDCKFIINSICSMNKCVCAENYSAFNELACAPTLNGPCLNDDQCFFGNFSCVNNKCQCRSSFIPVSVSQCVKENHLYSCADALDCSDLWHSACSKDKKCVCQPDNISIGRSCLPQLNGYCWRHDQCLIPNSECCDYRCTCKSNSIAVADNLCALQ